jgi:hypothetical protein
MDMTDMIENNNDKEYVKICDNDRGTTWPDCGQEYHIADGKCLPDHDPKCGEDSDLDSVEEYRKMTEMHNKIRDPKDYNNFINYLRSIYSENFEIYDTQQKVVIQKSLSRSNNQVYVLSVNGDIDLVLQYFTKVLLKSGTRPEDRYNLFILEMEAKSQTISLESITDYIFSYVIYELVYYAEEL